MNSSANLTVRLLGLFKTRRSRLFPKKENIIISPDLIIGRFVNTDIQGNGKLIIENGVSIREFCNILIFANGELQIGENVFFNNFCSINCLGSIKIGSNTIFGEGVKIYDHNHKYAYSQNKLEVQKHQFTIGKIGIGSNCWIGSNVTILNNVEIGDNVIIGANCLIHKSIPSNTIVMHSEDLIIKRPDVI